MLYCFSSSMTFPGWSLATASAGCSILSLHPCFQFIFLFIYLFGFIKFSHVWFCVFPPFVSPSPRRHEYQQFFFPACKFAAFKNSPRKNKVNGINEKNWNDTSEELADYFFSPPPYPSLALAPVDSLRICSSSPPSLTFGQKLNIYDVSFIYSFARIKKNKNLSS